MHFMHIRQKMKYFILIKKNKQKNTKKKTKKIVTPPQLMQWLCQSQAWQRRRAMIELVGNSVL
jgi:hypothetical protein